MTDNDSLAAGMRWTALLSRLVVGACLLAGSFRAFLTPGVHAVRTEPFAAYWTLINALLLLCGGIALLLGWRRRGVAIALAMALVPYALLAGRSAHESLAAAVPLVVALLPNLLLDAAQDPWSLDGWRRRRPSWSKHG